jgi:hypothetical protein
VRGCPKKNRNTRCPSGVAQFSVHRMAELSAPPDPASCEQQPLVNAVGSSENDFTRPSQSFLGLKPLLQNIHMSLGFFVLFTAFTFVSITRFGMISSKLEFRSINNILPAIVANHLGFYTLAVGNGVFCLSSLLIGPVRIYSTQNQGCLQC